MRTVLLWTGMMVAFALFAYVVIYHVKPAEPSPELPQAAEPSVLPMEHAGGLERMVAMALSHTVVYNGADVVEMEVGEVDVESFKHHFVNTGTERGWLIYNVPQVGRATHYAHMGIIMPAGDLDVLSVMAADPVTWIQRELASPHDMQASTNLSLRRVELRIGLSRLEFWARNGWEFVSIMSVILSLICGCAAFVQWILMVFNKPARGDAAHNDD